METRGQRPPCAGRILALILSGLALLSCDPLIDIEPPTIEIISPEEGSTYVATIPIELKVTDNHKVDRVELFLDDQPVQLFTNGPFVADLDISDFEEILMTLNVVAQDRAGNVAEAQRRISHSHGVMIVIPNGGEVWPERSTQTITWHQCNDVGAYVSLHYSLDGGTNWTQISASTPNNGSYLWILPAVSETRTACRVRVSCTDDSHSDMADSDFTITNWRPVWVGSCDTPGRSMGVFVSGSYAYVTDGYAGLEIIDIADPANPTHTGSYITPGDRTWDVFVSGSYAYVADGHPGLHIINVSNPASPTLASSYDTPGGVYGVFVSGSYAYVADGSAGLQVVNISNPASPALAGSCDTPGFAEGVFVSGSYAYVADGDAGLQIVNISNPENPTLAGFYDMPGGASGIFISGNYAYVAAGNAGLQIINVTDPYSLTWAGSFDTPGFARGVFVSGSYAYITDEYAGLQNTGLQIINVTDPDNPILTGSAPTPGMAWDVFVSGDHAYVTDHENGLLIFDIGGLP